MKLPVLLGVAVAILSCAACSSESSTQGGQVAVLHLVKEGRVTDTPRRLATVIPGSWDEATVLGPYTTADQANALVGSDPRIAASGISSRDDINVLVLRSGGRISDVFVVPRGDIDLSGLAGQSLRPDTCVRARDGQPRVLQVAECS